MKVCEQLEIDLQSPLMERFRHGFKREAIHHTETCKCSPRSLVRVSHSLDESGDGNYYYNNNGEEKNIHGGIERQHQEDPPDLVHQTAVVHEEVKRKASLAKSVLDLKTAFNQMAVTLASSSQSSSHERRDETTALSAHHSVSFGDQSAVGFDVVKDRVSFLPEKGSLTSLSLPQRTFSSHTMVLMQSQTPSKKESRFKTCRVVEDDESLGTTQQNPCKELRRRKSSIQALLECSLCSKCIMTLGFTAIFLFSCSFYFL